MADIQGSYDELFAAVTGVLAGLLEDGDAGGSIAVFVDGEPVVDVWGGFADAGRTAPWQRDTITNVYSVTKTMTALCALVLADRGELDLAAPVGRYWPEFAAAGTTVRVRDGNSVAWRRAQIPAASGFGNARSVALVQSVMACGGALRGRRLLLPAGCDRAREEQFQGVDRILGMQVRWGLGYGLFGSGSGWGGWGGSIVIVEPGTRMAVAYVTNQMREPADDNRGLEVIMTAYDGLKGLQA